MKIGIVGCAGRMGRMLCKEVMAGDGLELVGGTEYDGSEFIGADISELSGLHPAGPMVTTDTAALFAASDAVIDFPLPEATTHHAELAGEHGTAFVVGTTGLSSPQQATIEAAARSVAVVQAANFSIGVNLLLGLTEQTAGVLGADNDIEILEMHHRHKVDAPSGTALALGRAAASGRGVNLDDVSDRVRDGHTGARKDGDIGFATLRGGDVVGDHSVIFAAEGERIELTHKASSRSIFANGAVRAARWCEGKAPGLYAMRDVLGFK